MSRLSAIDRTQLPAEQRRFHDGVRAIRRRPISGPFIVLMNSSPDLAARFAHLGHYFHSRGQADESILSLRVRSFLALVGARALDAPYEWSAWVGWALEAGVPQATVDALREGRRPPRLTAEDALVLDFCTQLVTVGHRVDEATFTAVLDYFGVQGAVELVMSLGYFALIAFPLNAFEMEMSPEQKALRNPYAPLVVAPFVDGAEDGREVSSLPRRKSGRPRPRIPMIAGHADLKAEHQHFFDRIVRTRGHVAGVFQVLLHTPDVAERVANIGAFLLYDTILPPPIRLLVWLVTARELACEYAWTAGATEARKAGLPPELIEAIAGGSPRPPLSEEQAVVFAFCRELLRGNHHVSDVTYRATVAQFGVAATVQIAATLGYVAMMAFVLNAFKVEPPADDTWPAM